MSDNPLETIRAACKVAQANGITIVDNEWGITVRGNTWGCAHGELCAIAALVQGQPTSIGVIPIAMGLLNVDYAYIDGLITGFDGLKLNPYENQPGHLAGHAIGMLLREEFII